jgi:riboflavin transporter FmnP
MPRVTTWKVPLALWLFGFVVKIVLSILISETVGSWVGGTFGFLALVTSVLYAWNQSREARGQERTAHPEP